MNSRLTLAACAALLCFAADARAQIYHTIFGFSQKTIAGAEFRNDGASDYYVAEYPGRRLEVSISNPKTEAILDTTRTSLAVVVRLEAPATTSTMALQGDFAQVRIDAKGCKTEILGSYCEVELSGSKDILRCYGDKNQVLVGGAAISNEIHVEGASNLVYLDWGANYNSTWIEDRSGRSIYKEDGIGSPWFDNRAWMNGRRIS